jgi:thioredoxin-dependent peroxiredoxin
LQTRSGSRGPTGLKDPLPFTPLADPHHGAAETYGCAPRRDFGGKEYSGVERSTFAIDVDGNIAEVMHNVNPDRNPEQVLAAPPE